MLHAAPHLRLSRIKIEHHSSEDYDEGIFQREFLAMLFSINKPGKEELLELGEYLWPVQRTRY